MFNNYVAKEWKGLVLRLLLGAVMAQLGMLESQAVPADGFDFNDGTVQEWILEGAIDPEISGVTFSSNFSNGWNDYTNHPSVPGADPVGDARGSLQMYTPGDHGIDNPGGTWWIMRFRSPDLSSSAVWQSATGYSVKIAENMGGGGTTLYANLFVTVYDIDQDRDRYFTNGVAAPLANGVWSAPA